MNSCRNQAFSRELKQTPSCSHEVSAKHLRNKACRKSEAYHLVLIPTHLIIIVPITNKMDLTLFFPNLMIAEIFTWYLCLFVIVHHKHLHLLLVAGIWDAFNIYFWSYNVFTHVVRQELEPDFIINLWVKLNIYFFSFLHLRQVDVLRRRLSPQNLVLPPHCPVSRFSHGNPIKTVLMV